MTRLGGTGSGRRSCRVRIALVGALIAVAHSPAPADDDARRLYTAALDAVAREEREFWKGFSKRQSTAREVARVPWREMVRSMNGHGEQVDIRFDHSGFHALYDDYARLERERGAAAAALAATIGSASVPDLWAEILATCTAIDGAEAEVEAIDDPTGDTWAATEQGPGIRRHGLQVRLEGLIGALAGVKGVSSFLADTAWNEAAEGDRQRSITRRVAVLDLLAAAKAKEAIAVIDEALRDKWSSVRVAAVECALQLDPAPRPCLLSSLRDESPPVRRALLACVRTRAQADPRWIPALVERLPDTEGLERIECLATLAALAGRHLGPAPEAWRAWCEVQLPAIAGGTFRAESDDAGRSTTVALPSTTSFFGVTPLGEGIVFALDGGDNLLVPADYSVQRTRAFLDWVVGKRGWQKDHTRHREVQLREFSAALERLGPGVGFAVLLCTDNGNVKVMGDRKPLKGGSRDVQQAVRFLENHAPRGYRSEFANLRTALELAGLPVPGFDFPKPVADTILVVCDGSLRGGPYLDPDAATIAFTRWNRFRRVAIHTIRICNAGPDSERLMRGLADVGSGTYHWRQTPP